MEQKKKETKAQIERRLRNAVVLVEKTKDYMSVGFEDKGVRLAVTDEYAVISTNYHQHVFDNITASGVSRPYLYTKRVIELANENDCTVKDENGNAVGHSYAVLLNELNKKEDKSEYNIVYYYSWFLLNIFSPLYLIGESELETFGTYFEYIHNLAKNAVWLKEKTEDMTYAQFSKEYFDYMAEFSENIVDHVLFKKKTDEEVLQENVESMQEMMFNEELSENGES